MESCMVQPKSIQNKADALHFAVLATMKYECGVGNTIDYVEAKKLFDFFCDNIEFPQDDIVKMMGNLQEFIYKSLGKEDHGFPGNFTV